MAVSEAQKRATNKYNLKHYTVLGCKVKKEKAEAFKAACEGAGTSPNAVFINAIDEFMAGRKKAAFSVKGEDILRDEKEEKPKNAK